MLFAFCAIRLVAYVPADVARGSFEVADRLPGLAFQLLRPVAGHLTLELFCLSTNLVFHI